jgi:hypothetical protein
MKHYDSYKNFKKKLILKYKNNLSRSAVKNNLDSFVSINDFLAVEMSMGPKESPGNIDYSYQSQHNIFNYITILQNHYNFNEILCTPNFITKYGNNYMAVTSVVFFGDINQIVIPIKLKNKINNCMNKNIRFINFQFIIDHSKNDKVNHVNMIIIDLFKKTVERFEPFGSLGKDTEKKANHAIAIRLFKVLELTDFKYLSPLDISPEFGPQQKADAYGGMCVTFSMLYLQLRLMNPDIVQKEIVNYLLQKSAKELKNLVLRYAKFIEIALKKYDYINTEFNKFIRKEANDYQEYIFHNKSSYSVIPL